MPPVAPQLTIPSFRVIQMIQAQSEKENNELEKRKTTFIVYGVSEEIDSFLPQLCSELSLLHSSIKSKEVLTEAKCCTKHVIG